MTRDPEPTARFDRSSRARLTAYDLPRFTGSTLFDQLARAVCAAGCLPRKELYEAWEVARRARRRFRGGRVVDLACGHGLLAYAMLLLDDASPRALAVDRRIPPSAARIAASVCDAWPRLRGRVDPMETALDEVALEASDVVVSVHACGALTDAVIDRAMAARARLAVLPCCHDEATCDTGGLTGWLEVPLAIDATRVARLRRGGYTVQATTVPRAITPANRLLLAEPDEAAR